MWTPNIKSEIPSLSSSYYNTTSGTSVSQNSFSSLEELTSPGVPNATSSPIHRHILNNQTPTTTEPCKSHNLFKSNCPLKIVNIKFRSIKNRKPDLDILLDRLQPDIIIRTETWLDSSVPSSEYFSPENNTVFRNDRPPNKKGQSHGGVLTAVTSQIPSSSLPELHTNCEMVWAELIISNARKLLVCSHYRPHLDDDTSLPPPK